MYSQIDETDTLDVSEIKIFAAQPLWADFLKNNLKDFSVDFTLWWCYLCNFFERRKKKVKVTRGFQESPVGNEKL